MTSITPGGLVAGWMYKIFLIVAKNNHNKKLLRQAQFIYDLSDVPLNMYPSEKILIEWKKP